VIGDAEAYDAGRGGSPRRLAGPPRVFYQAPLSYTSGFLRRDWPSVAAARVLQAILGAAAAAPRPRRAIAVLAADRPARRPALALYAPAVYFTGILQVRPRPLRLSPARPRRAGPGDRRARCLAASAVGAGLAVHAHPRERGVLSWSSRSGWRQFRIVPWRTRGAALAAVLAGLAAVLFPVALRNQVVGGEFHLTTSQLGPNLYLGNNPAADGFYAPLRAGRGSPQFERIDARELAEQARGRALSPSEVSDYWRDEALRHHRAAGPWLALMARKTPSSQQRRGRRHRRLLRRGRRCWMLGALPGRGSSPPFALPPPGPS
jgi:hypothetical protein